MADHYKTLTPTLRAIADGIIAAMIGKDMDYVQRRRALAEWMQQTKPKFAEMTNGSLSPEMLTDVQCLISVAVLEQLEDADSQAGMTRGKAVVRTLRSKRRNKFNA